MMFYQKNLRHYQKEHGLRAITLFVSFLLLEILSLFCFAFFQSIYFYSGGFNDDYYYSLWYQESYLETYGKENFAYADDISSAINGETMTITLHGSENIEQSSGVLVNDRLFFSYREKDFKIKDDSLNDAFLYLSNGTSKEELPKNYQNYPVKGTFTFKQSTSTLLVFQELQVSKVHMAILVDSHYQAEGGQSFMVSFRNYSDLNGFESGKKFNNQVKSGYDIFLPLINAVILVPLITLLSALMASLGQICSFEVKEIYLRRMMGEKRGKNRRELLGHRLLPLLFSYLLSLVIFLPISHFVYSSLFACFLLSLVDFLFLFLGILIETDKDIRRTYRSGLNHAREVLHD